MLKYFILKIKSKANEKVTGIGGIFFKCKDPNKMRDWYQQNLGLKTNPYGAVFEWYQGADNSKKVLLPGVLLMTRPNILNLRQKNL